MRSFNFDTVKHITVYHGGSSPVEGPIKTPFFVSPDMKMAASYAVERGASDGHTGYLTQFEFKPRKIAHDSDIEAVCQQMGIDEDTLFQNSVYEFISPKIRDEANEVIRRLSEQGFDSACFSDFGMDCPFTEYEAYCVFDPSVLEFDAVIPVKN